MVKKFSFLIVLAILANFQGIHAQQDAHIDKSITIVGGGIIGLFEAYHTYLEAKAKGEIVQITVLEKNAKLSETTTCNIVPSLTPDEIMAVVPSGSEFVTSLEQKFNEGNGIRVDDVEGIDGTSEVVRRFIHSVEMYGKDEEAHQVRSEALLDLGKYSMDLWRNFYEMADNELKEVLRNSNYKPCLEVGFHEKELHRGYRIDLIFNDPEAKSKAQSMQIRYNNLAYQSSRILLPLEVISIDPQLKDFVYENTVLDSHGVLHWAEDAVALWRPGGCINTGLFLPKFVAYLEKKITTHSDGGVEQRLFEIMYDNEVIDVEYDDAHNLSQVKVKDSNGDIHFFPAIDKEIPKEFIFAPGEAVGTLRKLGFNEPDYAIFAGPSLRLSIEIPKDKIKCYRSLDQCMEVHQEGVVLSWQAKYANSKVFIGVGGSKAFYGDKKPKLNEEFARDRNIIQLNIMNKVYWDLISIALDKDSSGETLDQDDLDYLINKGIAKVWVGSRAVAYDGFPTLGALYSGSKIVHNARVTTHLGSGGAAFAFGAISMSRASEAYDKEFDQSIAPLVSKIIDFSDSRR